MTRFTDRTAAYRQRRAVALDYQEHVHDRLSEQRLRARHGQCGTGWKAHLVRKTLTDFAVRDAERNAA